MSIMMTQCANCSKEIPNESSNVSGITQVTLYNRMADDREMSRFLYRLTQEIVTSRDFSDANINRICEKYYQNTSFTNKYRLVQTIADLKQKLNIEGPKLIYNPTDEPTTIAKDSCSCPRSNISAVKVRRCDKCISVQSFHRASSVLKKQKNPFVPTIDDSTKKYTSSSDSISTITTYNFPSSMNFPFSGSPQFGRYKPPADFDKRIGEMLTQPGGNQLPELVEGCCGGNKNSKDSSADMTLRMAASERLFKGPPGNPKCPLHHCEHFSRADICGGGCGAGCASGYPPPRQNLPEDTESTQATCCGVSKKKRKPAGDKKNAPTKKTGKCSAKK
ncbi:uncharacterized protein LOC131683880 [Topomyia yanbarensis]|uniref:uncharacterized protein LOC131683880 n=1 Tax=Topomyia yanbarensis TaxID=2498891 RepID=UPI00273C0047|nr:uncharacterized protein LOC131683880 [Topomyia yanbarensis]